MGKTLHLLKRYSMRYQLIVLFFFIVMIPFIFIGYFSYDKSVKTIQDVNSMLSLESGKNLDLYLKFVNSTQNDIMYFQLQDMMPANPVSAFDEVSLAEQMSRLMQLLNGQPDLFQVKIFPIEPSRFPTYMSAIYGMNNVEQEEWFQRVKATGIPTWHLFFPEDAPTLYKEPTVSIIKRLGHIDGGLPRGIVVMDIPRATILDYLTPLKKVEDQEILLINEDNTIIHHSDVSKIGTAVSSVELLDFMNLNKSGTETMTIDGSRYLVTYTTLRHSGWKLVSMVPPEVLARSVSSIETITIMFMVFYLLLSIVVFLYITSSFSKPIEKLVIAMRNVERGQLEQRLPRIDRNDEIGWLYRGFANMVGRISTLIRDVETSARDKKELEFQVLTHQINPHFLYNTLESIRWKAENRDAHDISELVNSLGNLLRLSLNQGKELTTVKRELEHVRAYVNIETHRKELTVRIVYLVDEDIQGLPVLRLLLQPLVENALQHAFPTRTDGTGKIIIKGMRDGDDIVFEIIDNGVGIPEHTRSRLLMGDPAVSSAEGGVGLRNVHERLHIYFGLSYGLSIHSACDAGTVIKLRHPVLPDRAEQAEAAV